MPQWVSISASTAGPPSPPRPTLPLPAMVVMMPVAASIRLIVELPRSERYRLPSSSMRRSWGWSNRAPPAGPPSPELPGTPFPANSCRIPTTSMRQIRWPQ